MRQQNLELTIKEIINDKKLFRSMEYKRRYEKAIQELEDYKGSRLKYKRRYEKVIQELEDYKGARLKYKRLASEYEYKYKKLYNSRYYKFIRQLKKIIFLPFSLFNKNNIKKPLISTVLIKEETINRNDVYNFFNKYSFVDHPTTLIYADLNINIVDGSSIWLSSVINLFQKKSKVIVVSKFNIENELVISNIFNRKELIIIQPNDLGLRDELPLQLINSTLIYIDEVIPSIQNIVIRGTEAIAEILKTNNFMYRLVPYLTNFYQQTRDGIDIKEESIKTIKLAVLQAKYWLWQTDEMKTFIEKSLNITFENYILFPPLIENIKINNINIYNNKQIIIGYAGKIQPDWGILELIEEVEKLRKKGLDIKLKIVSSKISWRGTIKSGKGFVEKIKKYLEKDYIEYLQNLNREESIKAMMDVDYIWSWRDSDFENTTLELSTKLLEGVSLGKPVINYPSEIHKGALGNAYPFYLKSVKDLEEILDIKIEKSYLNKKRGEIIKKYSYLTREKVIGHFFKPLNEKNILLNGHDFKFIDHFYSYLKSNGYKVIKDYWEWGEADNLNRSQAFLNKSDIILCEWGLANAVWYSKQNKNTKKTLFIRSHLQEINPKAKKFGPQINMKNVDKNIFVSERVRDIAIKKWQWNKEKTKVISNYVLVSNFKPLYMDKKIGLNFGMVGITPQRKRLDRAISLMELILKKYPDAKLYIKGMRPENYEWMHAPGRVEELDYYFKQYDRIRKDPMLNKAIIFDGFSNNMAEWYQKIDFILSPSDFESFHYALADGVASGCLPIVWNWDESIKLYSDEWVVSNSDDAYLKVKYYLNLDKNSIKRNIQKNRQLIIQRYGYESIYNQLSSQLGI